MYSCPKCKKSISKQVRTLIRHLRQVHAISDGQDYTIVCSQNHCQRTYHNFNSYARHINREHTQVANPVNLEQMVNFGNGSEDVSTSCSNAMKTPQTDSETSMDCHVSDHRETAASFVAKMYCASNSTLTDVQKSIACTKELLEKTLDDLKDKTASVIDSYSLSNL